MDHVEVISNGNKSNAVESPISVFDAMEGLPCNATIADNFVRAWSIINRTMYQKVIATISGGSDSDVVLDILTRCDKNKKIEYVWVDTGLEYQATKEHLDYLEKKYNITFRRIRPKKPIPLAVKEYGQPFLNKKPVSEYINRLQKHNFKWEDESYDILNERYPGCESALKWWCNLNKGDCNNIRHNKLLKEYIIANPPTFRISQECCKWAKKSVVHAIIKREHVDLNIFGVRKAEGGARASSYKSCFGSKCDPYGTYDEYRPIWWYKNEDKKDYCCACNIEHSKCYTEYGLPRTGCCGCPFGRDFEHELEVAKKYEPKLYTAAMNLFKDSYDYTRKYREFVKNHS